MIGRLQRLASQSVMLGVLFVFIALLVRAMFPEQLLALPLVQEFLSSSLGMIVDFFWRPASAGIGWTITITHEFFNGLLENETSAQLYKAILEGVVTGLVLGALTLIYTTIRMRSVQQFCSKHVWITVDILSARMRSIIAKIQLDGKTLKEWGDEELERRANNNETFKLATISVDEGVRSDLIDIAVLVDRFIEFPATYNYALSRGARKDAEFLKDYAMSTKAIVAAMLETAKSPNNEPIEIDRMVYKQVVYRDSLDDYETVDLEDIMIIIYDLAIQLADKLEGRDWLYLGVRGPYGRYAPVWLRPLIQDFRGTFKRRKKDKKAETTRSTFFRSAPTEIPKAAIGAGQLNAA